MDFKDIVVIAIVLMVAAFLRGGKSGSTSSFNSSNTLRRNTSTSNDNSKNNYTSNSVDYVNNNSDRNRANILNREAQANDYTDNAVKPKHNKNEGLKEAPSNPTTSQTNGPTDPRNTQPPTQVVVLSGTTSQSQGNVVNAFQEVNPLLANELNGSLSEQHYERLYALIKDIKGSEGVLSSHRVNILYSIITMVQQRYWSVYKNNGDLNDAWVKQYGRIIIPLQNFPSTIEDISYFENGQWINRKKEFTQLHSPYLALPEGEDELLRLMLNLVDSHIIKSSKPSENSNPQIEQVVDKSTSLLSEIIYITNFVMFLVLVDLVQGIAEDASKKGFPTNAVYRVLTSLSDKKNKEQEFLNVREYAYGHGIDLVTNQGEELGFYYNCDKDASTLLEKDYSKFVVLNNLEFFNSLDLATLTVLAVVKKNQSNDLRLYKLAVLEPPHKKQRTKNNSDLIKEDELPVIPEAVYLTKRNESPTLKQLNRTQLLTQEQSTIITLLNNYTISEQTISKNFQKYHTKLTMK